MLETILRSLLRSSGRRSVAAREAESVATAKQKARRGQDWFKRQQLRPHPVYRDVRSAPPAKVLTAEQRRARRLSTRAHRRRAHRAASLAMTGLPRAGRAS